MYDVFVFTCILIHLLSFNINAIANDNIADMYTACMTSKLNTKMICSPSCPTKGELPKIK